MNKATAAQHLSRLPGDAVPPVDGLHDSNSDDFWPVSGRSEPRPAPRTTPCDVRFKAAALDPALGVTAYCEPCNWSNYLEPGHTLADMHRLVAMHEGAPGRLCNAATVGFRCQLPAGHYKHHHADYGRSSVTWPQDETVFGTETEPQS